MRLQQNHIYQWTVRTALVPCIGVPVILLGMLSQWTTVTLLKQSPMGAGCETSAQATWPLPPVDAPVVAPPGVEVVEIRDMTTGQTVFGKAPAPVAPPKKPAKVPSAPVPAEVKVTATATTKKPKRGTVVVAVTAVVAVAAIAILTRSATS